MAVQLCAGPRCMHGSASAPRLAAVCCLAPGTTSKLLCCTPMHHCMPPLCWRTVQAAVRPLSGPRAGFSRSMYSAAYGRDQAAHAALTQGRQAPAPASHLHHLEQRAPGGGAASPNLRLLQRGGGRGATGERQRQQQQQQQTGSGKEGWGGSRGVDNAAAAHKSRHRQHRRMPARLGSGQAKRVDRGAHLQAVLLRAGLHRRRRQLQLLQLAAPGVGGTLQAAGCWSGGQ